MARISRVVASGYPHHITQRGVRSIPIFQTESDRRAYLDFMSQGLNRFGVEVLAWCLMTNHTHLIVVPNDAAVLARAIGEAHRRYTRMKNFSDGVRGYLLTCFFTNETETKSEGLSVHPCCCLSQ
jgi:putative transposase